jgi:tetratricopeptide (TPR) repeat protein
MRLEPGFTSWRTGLVQRHLIRAAVFMLAFGPVAVTAAATPPNDVQKIARQGTASGSYLAGRYASAQRDADAAATFLLSALKSDPNNPDLLDRAFRSVLASGNVAGALDLAERLVALDSTNRVAQLTVAVNAIKSRQPVSARTYLAPAIEAQTPDVAATLVTGWSWYASGDPKKALEVFGRLTGNELTDYLRDLHSGLMADAAGLKEEAGTRLAAAYKVDPNTFLVADAYARWLARADRRDEAKTVYETALQAFPNDPRAYSALMDLNDGKVLGPAVRTARDGVAEVLFSFGRLANRSESAEISQVYLNLALFLVPDHELAVLTLADLSETIGQTQAAIEAYQRLSPKSVYKRDAEVRVAVNLASLDKLKEARAQLETLIYRAPNDLDAYVALGGLLHREKHYAEAAQVYSRAISVIGEPRPEHWSLFFARAVAYDAAKRWPQAEADLKKALELSGEQPTLLNYLGYSWVDRRIDVEKGLDLIRQAVEMRPNDGDIVDSLGWAYYRLGKYNEAVDELERAIDLRPQSWEINDHLGDVYWKVGRKLEARFQWAHARDLKPDPEKLALIERKINEGLEPVETDLAAKRAEEDAKAAANPPLPVEGETPTATASGPRPDSFTVRPGDTLWTIADEVFGDGNRYPDLIRANEQLRRNPNNLVPGQVLKVPAR